jgi:enterochelin esterase-like enzyme
MIAPILTDAVSKAGLHGGSELVVGILAGTIPLDNPGNSTRRNVHLRFPLYLALAAVFTLTALLAAEENLFPEKELVEMAQKNPSSPEFRALLDKEFGAEKLKNGEAATSYGPDFVYVLESATQPVLYIDDQPVGKPKRVKGSDLWLHTAKLKAGTSHAYFFEVDGKQVGRRIDLPAYGPDSYPKAGVPQGSVSEKIVHTSKIYPGMQSDYWVYVSPGYDAQSGAALMVWQDGQNYAQRNSRTRLAIVTENLLHQKKIPPMIHVMVAPGTVGEKRMRSIEYDTVSDRYSRFILEEILPEVEKKYKIRKDAYSRGIGGESSGGICAFTAAYFRPEEFSRVLSRIGSYTSIQWSTNPADDLQGGQNYPFKVRKEPKRNIRVWLEDGSEDLENNHGSWPLQNIQMANSLKMKEYDFKLSWHNNAHNTAHGNAELPEALTWLWRDYDPAKTQQTYEMDPAEKEKPYFRVRIYNR